MAEPKTNALRLLDARKIKYTARSYEAPGGFLDGVSVAEQLGMDKAAVYKTLVTWGGSKAYYVCVIPVAEELDLKKAAKHFGEKKLDMIPSKDITSVTGYIKGGCSPIGMKKLFPTAIDSAVSFMDQVAVSGGRVGLQVELPVSALIDMTRAAIADLTIKDQDAESYG